MKLIALALNCADCPKMAQLFRLVRFTSKQGRIECCREREWGEVTFMKEWMKALLVAVILAPTDLRYLVSFPRYGCLNEKFRDKFFPNSKYIFLFIELLESYFGKHT